MSPGFRFQQAVKYVVGIERELPSDVRVSLDLVHTRSRNSLDISDVNLVERAENAEGRLMYGVISGRDATIPARSGMSYQSRPTLGMATWQYRITSGMQVA